MTDLGAAVVGCRAVAPLHAKGFVRAHGARLVAVCDRDPEAARGLAEEFGVEAVTGYDQILEREDIQLVSLVTPDELHAPMAIAAAQAGKHVLVEKPIAMTLAELDEMITAADIAGVKMMCAQSLRYRPKFRAIRDAIQAGCIGRPVFARMSSPSSPFWTPEKWAQYGYDAKRGPDWLLMHNGMHQFDYLSLLFESPIREVYAVSHPGQDWLRVHEYVAVNMQFENGAFALSEENRIMQPPGHPFHCDLYIVGTEGTIDAGDRQTFSVCSYSGQGIDFPGAHITLAGAERAFAGEVQAIVDAIRTGEEPDIPLAFTRQVLKGLRTACRSFESGRNEDVRTFVEEERGVA